MFCSSCVGKLTKIDLERSFEVLNAILQFDCFFVFGRFLRVLKNKAESSSDVGYDFGLFCATLYFLTLLSAGMLRTRDPMP